MKPSTFLQNRFPDALRDIAGEGTVDYISFDAAGTNPRTGEINETTAYAATPKSISALIDLTPSKAMRERVGQDVEFEAILIITRTHLEAASIGLKFGDAFVIPGETAKYYVKKIIRDMQVGNEFLETVVAVGHKRGGK